MGNIDQAATPLHVVLTHILFHASSLIQLVSQRLLGKSLIFQEVHIAVPGHPCLFLGNPLAAGWPPDLDTKDQGCNQG